MSTDEELITQLNYVKINIEYKKELLEEKINELIKDFIFETGVEIAKISQHKAPSQPYNRSLPFKIDLNAIYFK